MRNLVKNIIDADYRHYSHVLSIAEQADALKDEMRLKSDEELLKIHHELQYNFENNQKLAEAVALIREVDYRKVGEFPYFVQLIGGLILYFNDIAEMKTGEGKTLTTTIPVYLKCLEGKYVHVVTTNEYLSARNYNLLKPVFEFLGIHMGLNSHELNKIAKRMVYMNQIVYTTNSELGFDYLRDSFVMSANEKVVPHMEYAIIDEIDSILIDEARTPLIISGMSDDDPSEYMKYQNFIDTLRNDDVEVDIETRSVTLSEKGISKAHAYFHKDNLYAPENMPIIHKMNQALRANYLFKNGVDYVVRNDEVLIVDEYTGRILAGREFSDGLHQALQAKEHVSIKPQNRSEATITYQNLFRLYNELSGMSGTVKSEELELFTCYNLRSFEVPTNKPNIRLDGEDQVYPTKKEKIDAIILDIERIHKKGNPILVGTASIEDSLILSKRLNMVKLPHVVLNGIQDENEAHIVAQAGQAGRITIATNIAGRGTDIPLNEQAKVLGGLYVLGFERFDSKRIDNQLKGRCARQGDPGYSCMYVSLEDNLILKYANEEQKKELLSKVKRGKKVEKLIDSIQKQAESMNYNSRKRLLEYDDELAMHRSIMFKLRDSLLCDENVRKEITYCLNQYFEKHQIANKDVKIANVLHGIDTNTTYSYQIMQSAMLRNINYLWRNHVDDMVEAKKGIEYRSYAQIKPVDAYKEEAYRLFSSMWENYYESVGNMLLSK